MSRSPTQLPLSRALWLTLLAAALLLAALGVVAPAAQAAPAAPAAQAIIDFNNVSANFIPSAYTGSQEDGFNIAAAGEVRKAIPISPFPPFSGTYIIGRATGTGSLTITKLDALSFQFQQMDVRCDCSFDGNPHITVQGYVGGTGGTLAGSDDYYIQQYTSVPGTVSASNLAGKTVDTLVVTLYGFQSQTSYGQAQIDNIVVEAQQADFGDAPDSYGTTLAANGARHILGGTLLLGTTIDAEADGLASAAADGDDLTNTDDETGVLPIQGLANAGWTEGTVASGNGGGVAVNVTGGSACLGAFVDFNRDGDFADSGEAVQLYDANGAAVAQPIAPAAVFLYFDVPAGTFSGSSGPIFARFRVTSPVNDNCSGSPAHSPLGLAPDGEVEDYGWSFGPNAVQVSRFAAQATGLGDWLTQLWRMLTGR